ncbi:MAG: hypothetical protein WB615_13410 [Candidatus Tumulicola sp.]
MWKVLLASLITACIAACGPRDAAYDTSAFRIHDTIAPPDVAVPSNRGDASSEFNGLYLEGSDAFSCCWIAPHAHLLVRKRSPARELVAGFRVPNLPRFRNGQDVAVRLPGRGDPYRAHIAPNEQRTLVLRLPPNLRNAIGLVPIEITTAVDFVPSRDTPPSHSLFSVFHLLARMPSDDTRHLGIVVLYLYFE